LVLELHLSHPRVWDVADGMGRDVDSESLDEPQWDCAGEDDRDDDDDDVWLECGDDGTSAITASSPSASEWGAPSAPSSSMLAREEELAFEVSRL